MTAAQPGGRTDLGSGLYERLSCWHCESFLHLSTAIVGAVRLRVASEVQRVVRNLRRCNSTRKPRFSHPISF